jgi:3-hydroxyisobutyrate dehydrogenase
MDVTLPPPAECPVGWIGLGVMGRSMAAHLLAAGHPMIVHTRTRSTAAELLDAGAMWADTPAGVTRGALVVATMVGYPQDLTDVVLGTHGALAAMDEGATLVDFTTSTPALAIEIAEVAARQGIVSIDAPVSGGDVGARNATLSIMVGGDNSAVERVRPLLDRLGTTVIRQGGSGAGQHTKAVNQTLVAGTMIGLCEAIVYARAVGLDPATVLESVSGGAAGSWALTNLAPRILRDDLEPGFAIEHFTKDLGIVLDECARVGITLPGVGLAHRLYADLTATGHGRRGTQALITAIDTGAPHAREP